jgi:RND family efflux transporter MFP subunit
MNIPSQILKPIGIVAGSVVLAFIMIAIRPEPPRRPPEPNDPLVFVESIALKSGSITVFGNGTVRPHSEIDVSSEVSGKIVEVSPNMQSGGRVYEGEVLVKIDPTDYLNRVEQAMAEVAMQRVAVLQAEEEAKIAQDEYQQFQAREKQKGKTTIPPSSLTLREPQRQAAIANLSRAEAQLRDAELALSRTDVVMPFNGRVRDEIADLGRYVIPGQSLGRIYASDFVEVVIPISGDDAVLIPNLWSFQAGDFDPSVGVTVIAVYGERKITWDGYVDRAETTLDAQSRTIDVVVRVHGPFYSGKSSDSMVEIPPLLVGEFVKVEIQGLELDEYFVVPLRALRPGNEIWIINSSSQVKIVPVDVLQRTGEEIFVTGDLKDNQSVIVAGTSIATDGMDVRVANPEGR